jgi:succinate dehydrogenase / fumarate reductase, membrane anchor subunit
VRGRLTGLPAWWVQRASALFILAFVVLSVGALSLHPHPSYAQWKAWAGNPGVALALCVFFTALFAHMWVGLRDLILDYARPAGLRVVLLFMLAAALLGAAAWVLRILVRL